ncbi:MAG: hypothetical protein LBD68_04875 [Zoogloeaceae bacterium]|nr:hypothetical protein [Zoogloeaceae bacterium]
MSQKLRRKHELCFRAGGERDMAINCAIAMTDEQKPWFSRFARRHHACQRDAAKIETAHQSNQPALPPRHAQRLFSSYGFQQNGRGMHRIVSAKTTVSAKTAAARMNR